MVTAEEIREEARIMSYALDSRIPICILEKAIEKGILLEKSTYSKINPKIKIEKKKR